MSTKSEGVKFAEAIVPVLDGPFGEPVEQEGLGGDRRIWRLSVRATLSTEPPRLDVSTHAHAVPTARRPGVAPNDAYKVDVETDDRGTVAIEAETNPVADGDTLRHSASPDAAIAAVGDLCAKLGFEYRLWPPEGSEPARLAVEPEARNLHVEGEPGKSRFYPDVLSTSLAVAGMHAALQVLATQPDGFRPEPSSFNPVEQPAAA